VIHKLVMMKLMVGGKHGRKSIGGYWKGSQIYIFFDIMKVPKRISS